MADLSNVTSFDCGYEEYQGFYTSAGNSSLMAIVVMLILATLIGNGVTIMAVVEIPKLRTTQNIFFCSLSVSDFTLAAIVLPCRLVYEVLGYWPLGLFVCRIYIALDVFLCTASIWNLCLISINRYVAVTQRTRYRQFCKRRNIMLIVMSGWIWSALVCLPGFIFSQLKAVDENPWKCAHSTEKWYILFSVSGSFYIPLFIMLVTYGRISWLLNQMAKVSQVREMCLRRQKRLHWMTGLVLGAFIICWFPFFQTYVVQSLCPSCCVPPWLLKFLEWFAYCNSTVNPFIYSMAKRDLRNGINMVLRNRGAVFRNMKANVTPMPNRPDPEGDSQDEEGNDESYNSSARMGIVEDGDCSQPRPATSNLMKIAWEAHHPIAPNQKRHKLSRMSLQLESARKLQLRSLQSRRVKPFRSMEMDNVNSEGRKWLSSSEGTFALSTQQQTTLMGSPSDRSKQPIKTQLYQINEEGEDSAVSSHEPETYEKAKLQHRRSSIAKFLRMKQIAYVKKRAGISKDRKISETAADDDTAKEAEKVEVAKEEYLEEAKQSGEAEESERAEKSEEVEKSEEMEDSEEAAQLQEVEEYDKMKEADGTKEAEKVEDITPPLSPISEKQLPVVAQDYDKKTSE